MKKKIFASLTALACVASMAASVAAASTAAPVTTAASVAVATGANGGYSSTITTEAGILVPTLNLTVPGTVAVALNPYKIKVTVDGTADVQNTILSPAMELTSLSACEVDVKVQATAEAKGSAMFQKAKPADTTTDTKKDVYMFLTGTRTKTNVKLDDDAALADTVKFGKQSDYVAADSAVNIAFNGTAVESIGSIAEATTTPSKFYVAVNGWCNPTPKEAWAAADGVNISIVYDFTPAVAATP